jgi:hypothetical protein
MTVMVVKNQNTKPVMELGWVCVMTLQRKNCRKLKIMMSEKDN